ncbi:MAG: protein translocase subunit SecF [Ruminococcus sp.]|nr:protein translocase subunit SecF [Ruminococcus sp.]
MKRGKKPVFFIVLLCIAAFAYLTYSGISTQYGDIKTTYIKGVDEIRWGIDIQGGVNATFEPANGYDASEKDMDSAKAIIEQRLVSLNITDSDVYVDYNKKRVMVSFPWQAGEESFDPEEAVSELGETALLTFRRGSDETGEEILTGENVKNAEATQYTNNNGDLTYVVSLEFDSEGSKAFATATSELIGSPISIWMDDKCISAPNVNSAITDGKCQIEGNFTYDSAKALADKINAGSLPFKLETTSTNIISATLGEGARTAMIIAGAIAFIMIAIYMTIIYKLPGFVASLALFGQVVGTIACISGFFGNIESFTLTIPGIAGIILAIGMGVDANVITAERIKEELRSGKTLNGAIELGYKRAWSAVFDGNITVVFVAIILMGAFGPTDGIFATFLKPIFFAFGAATAGTIYSLGYTLLVGIILNFVFGIFCSRLMLSSLAQFKCFKKRTLYGGFADDDTAAKEKYEAAKAKKFNVVGNKKKFYAASVALFVAFGIVTAVFSLNVAIEFKGGTIIQYTYKGDIDASAVETAVKDAISEDAIVTKGENFSSDDTTIKLSFSSKEGISDDKQATLAAALKEKFPDNNIELLESSDVSASNGLEFFFKCLVAVAAAAVITIIYIAFRFRKIGGLSAGVFSVVALIHDMIMVFGCFAICRFDINANFMAVLLTILGYSINATIIIYDRIRENRRLYGNKYSLDEMVNMSVTQTLGRSINTTVTTVMAMATVCVVCTIYGVSSIISFAFPLIIGMIAGVYSSNCIAPTLWVAWQDHKAKAAKKAGYAKKKK